MTRRKRVPPGSVVATLEALIAASSERDLELFVLLGWMLAVGDGLRRDVGAAVRIFAAAAKRGEPTAEFNLGAAYLSGKGVPKSPARAARLFRRAAQHGSLNAMVRLGTDVFLHTNPARRARAIALLRTAERRGRPEAAFILGQFYDFGDDRGDGRDPRRALRWYRKAATAGVPGAMVNLALCLARGEGGPVDLPQARAWLRKAVKRGHPRAKKLLASVKG